MGVQNVTRRVDTVIMEVDISVAEQLLEILELVHDETRKSYSYQGSDINALRVALIESAEVRCPSPLYVANVEPIGYVELTDKI